MRLSATDRIINEAEQQDAGGAATRPVSPGEAAPSSTARDLFTLRESRANFDVDIEDINVADDEEGETLVDAERAAAALQEMRSYGASRSRSPSNDVKSRSADSPPRRGSNGLPPMAKPPGPVVPNSAPPTPTLRWAGGVPPGRPTAPSPSPVTPAPVENRPLLPVSAAPSTSFDVNPPSQPSPTSRRTVGRRSGIAIALATAAVVALGIGTWTARSGVKSPASHDRPVRAAVTPRGPVTAAIPPSPSEVPVEPMPEPAAALPTVLEATPVATATVAPRATRASAKATKSRSFRKPTAHKARRSKHHAAKVATPRAQPKRVVEAANPAPVRVQGATRSVSDPDATLPITD